MTDKSDNGEKTEAPTAHRLKKSMESGQAPRFTAVSILTGLLGGMLGLGFSWLAMAGSIKTGFAKALQVTQRPGWRDGHISAELFENALSAGKIMLPFFITILIVSLLAAYCVSGFSLSWHRVRVNLNRCNPIKGWQQWLGFDVWINVASTFLKCLCIALVFVGLIKMQYGSVLCFDQLNAAIGSGQVMHWCFMATLSLISPLIIWTVMEVFYQKWSFFNKMKMSKQEVKEENKQEEGHPEIKMKIKQTRYQQSTHKTAEWMKTATVLITDGQRAVVLRYAENKFSAPILLDKCWGFKTKQLQKLAHQYGVPQVTEALLTQQLFTQGIKGRLIPAPLYAAVAKLLADIKTCLKKSGGPGNEVTE